MNAAALDPQTYAIIGAAMAVHGTLGSGFLESVYQEAMALELEFRRVPNEREVTIPISYRGRLLGTPYRADFVCFDQVIVELKASSSLSRIDEAQLIHYLKATGLLRGLLLNFGGASLQWQRVVLGSADGMGGGKVARPQATASDRHS
jgi:GxxExxY protein